VTSCPVFSAPPPRDGVEMSPAATKPTDMPLIDTVTIGGTRISTFWYRGVVMTIGLGPDPAIAREVVDSIAFDDGAPDTPVKDKCGRNPAPNTMPNTERVGQPFVLNEHEKVTLEPLDPGDAPAVPAATVWGHGEKSSLLRFRLF